MSDHVIITGVRRARELVSVAELKQMCGRCGRIQNGLSYSADIILNDCDYEIENKIKQGENYDIKSTLSTVENFCFAIMPEIVNGNIKNIEEIGSYYKKTLGFFQGVELDFYKVLNYLIKNEAIQIKDDSFVILDNSHISNKYYFSVGDIKRLRDNFKRVITNDRNSDGAIAWALGNIESIKIYGDFGDHYTEIERFQSDLPSDYVCEDGTIITSSLWWCMMGNGSAGKQMLNNVRLLKKHIGRIIKVLIEFGYDKVFCKDLELRVMKNISRELLPFFHNQNMTKSRALGLQWMGYQNSYGTEDVEID